MTTLRPWDPEVVAEKRAARRRRNTLLAIVGALGLVVLIAVVVALVTDDDEPGVAASETTGAATSTTVARPTTSTAGSSSTTTATTAAGSGTATTSPGRTPSSGPATTVPAGVTTTAAGGLPAATTTPAPGATSTPTPTPAPSPEPTAGTTPTTVTPPSGAGTLDNPVPRGASAAIGNGWELRVDAYVPDATDAVMAEDEFNELPPDGFVYALATLSVTYVGSEPPGDLFDVFVGAVGPNDFETEMFSCDAIAPDELDPLIEVDQGATVTGNVCFSLPVDAATSVVMFATGGFDTDDVYFALF